MIIIGLTGPSGSGKSEIASLLKEKGFPHINCDEVYHSLLTPESECTGELAAFFSPEILFEDGSVDRKKLAESVFVGDGHEEKLITLGRITHKYVLGKCRDLIKEFERCGKTAVIVDAPTLIESGFDRECDAVLVVTAPKEMRLCRISERDGITREAALDRISAQKPDSFYTERADFVIENVSSRDELRERVDEFTERFIKENQP